MLPCSPTPLPSLRGVPVEGSDESEKKRYLDEIRGVNPVNQVRICLKRLVVHFGFPFGFDFCCKMSFLMFLFSPLPLTQSVHAIAQ
jgi:hypothetical protein